MIIMAMNSLQLRFCSRFHFTEGMKSGGGQEGDAMVVQMIASLGEALECQYGRICTRLARAFRPKPVSATSGWKLVSYRILINSSLVGCTCSEIILQQSVIYFLKRSSYV